MATNSWFHAATREKAIAAGSEMAMRSREEPGCIEYRFAIDIDDPIEDIRARLGTSHHTVQPVYSRQLDEIVGVLHVKDFMRARVQGQRLNLAGLVRPLPNVAASATAEDLLALFKRERVHAALVVDDCEAAREALAALGHPVALGARRIDECEETAEAIRAAGGEAVAIHLDLADGDSVERFAAAAVDALGAVEIVVSNAGQNMAGAVLDMDSTSLDAVLDVNIGGTHRLVRSLVPAMTGRRRGDIVFVTSDVAERPRPAMAAYVTSKWGLEGYVHALQMELEGSGVRATILRPGPTMTGMGFDWDPVQTGEIIEQWAAWGFARHGNFMRPEGVAQAVCAVVALPRGVHATVIELQPEAPIAPPDEQGDQ